MSKITTKLPTWDDARHLLNQFKGHALMTVAAKVCLGITLQQLKEKEGYTRGRHTADGGMSWPELLKQELNLSEDSARRFILAGDAVKAKIAKIGGGEHLIGLLDQPVQSLSKADAETLQAAIRTATDGESLTSILQEFKLIKTTGKLTAADRSKGGSAERQPTTDEQLEFAAFHYASSIAHQICEWQQDKTYRAQLSLLPLTTTEPGKPGLVELKAVLEDQVLSLTEVINAKMKASK